MNKGTPTFGLPKIFILVGVNAVADTTFTPFWNTSAVAPFHLMAILQVSVVVVNKFVKLPPIALYTKSLPDATGGIKTREFTVKAVVSPNPKND